MKNTYVMMVLLASGIYSASPASDAWKKQKIEQQKQELKAKAAEEAEHAKTVRAVTIGSQRFKELQEKAGTAGVIKILPTAKQPSDLPPKLPRVTLPPSDLPPQLPEGYKRTVPARPTSPLPKAVKAEEQGKKGSQKLDDITASEEINVVKKSQQKAGEKTEDIFIDAKSQLKITEAKLSELNDAYKAARDQYEQQNATKRMLELDYRETLDNIKRLEKSSVNNKDKKIENLKKSLDSINKDLDDTQNTIDASRKALGEITRERQTAQKEIGDLKKQVTAEARRSVPKPLPRPPSKQVSREDIVRMEIAEARIEEFTDTEKAKEKDVLEKSKVSEAKQEEELKGPPPPPSDAVVLTRSVVEKQIAALEDKDIRERTPQEQQKLNSLKQTLGGFLTPEERKKAQEEAEFEEYWKGPSDVKTKEQQERVLEQLGKLVKKPGAEQTTPGVQPPPPPAPPMLVSPAKQKTVAPTVVKKQTAQESGDVMEQIKAGVQLKKVEKKGETPAQKAGVAGALQEKVGEFVKGKGSEEPVSGQDLRAAEEWE